MTYRTDPYDPKQPALLAPEALEDAVAAAEKAFAAASDPTPLPRSATSTSVTGRRCRWPGGRSARCLRPPRPTPASG